jgi:hypothetical protein
LQFMQRAPALKVGPASNGVGVQGSDWDHFALRQPVLTLLKGTPDPRSSSVIPRTVDATCAARFATRAPGIKGPQSPQTHRNASMRLRRETKRRPLKKAPST